ncbi:MAG: tetratricopeptide repeat protein, partial [Proteobacteria bacterium]|nr:tetratricopeptide repeat protein [Pseudomonadota bacterium]
RQRRGYKALTQGMVAVAAGDATEARRQARRAEALLSEPPLTMLLSAQAAQLSGDNQAAGKFFEAMSEQPETKFLGLRGKLNQAMEKGDSDGALALAEQAHDLKPKTDAVTSTLFELQLKHGEWAEAEETVREAVKDKLISAEVGKRRRAVLLYQQSIEAENEGRRNDALQMVRKAHNYAPSFVPAAARVARLLAGAGKRRRATATIEETWVSNPHPHLVEVLEEIGEGTSAEERLRMVERLVRYNAGHEETHIAVARLAIGAGRWQEAREHLESLAADDPSARVCRFMAEWEEIEGGAPAAARIWLKRAADADPDSAWLCNHCGNVVADWEPVCGRCETFDSYSWKTPPRVIRMDRAEDEPTTDDDIIEDIISVEPEIDVPEPIEPDAAKPKSKSDDVPILG